jgi:DNA-binding MarR family transcriptional regulator
MTPTPADTEAAPELAGRLRLAVARLNRLLRQQSDLDLPPTRLAHLSTIERHGPLTLGDLATTERVAPATVTKVVKHLETLGFVVRRRDAADRRVVRVELTDAGRERLRSTRTRKNAWLAQRVDALDASDRAHLSAAMTVLEQLAESED